MIESIMTKRPALYKGEVGIFPDSEPAQNDLALATMYAELKVKWYSERNIKRQNFLWTMVYKAWQNSDFWLDHHEAMIDLKKRVHFTRMVRSWEEKEKMKERIRSMTRISDEQLRLLTDRIADVICAEVMPGMQKNDLYREVEEMVGVQTKNE